MSHPVHTMRALLFQVLGLSLHESFEEVILKLRKSVYFMGKQAHIPLEELSCYVLEYADLIGTVQQIESSPLPMNQRFYLLYISHMFELDPHKAYGLIDSKQSTR